MGDDGFVIYDYDKYDDYYFYYEDKYADMIDVYYYFFLISDPLRNVILSKDAEEVFTTLSSSLMGLVNSMPLKTTLGLLRRALKDLKKSIEAGAVEPLTNMLGKAKELMVMSEEEAKTKTEADAMADEEAQNQAEEDHAVMSRRAQSHRQRQMQSRRKGQKRQQKQGLVQTCRGGQR